jgi:hypothetical protein
VGEDEQRPRVVAGLGFVVPVLLGDGVRFFSSPDLGRIDLEPIDSTRAGDLTVLRFRVLK